MRNARVVWSDDPRLNEPALTAVSQWLWKPGTLKGEPVDTEFSVTIQFNVH